MFLRTITIKGGTCFYFYEFYYENGKTKQNALRTLYQFLHYDDILDECGKVFRLELNNP